MSQVLQANRSGAPPAGKPKPRGGAALRWRLRERSKRPKSNGSGGKERSTQ